MITDQTINLICEQITEMHVKHLRDVVSALDACLNDTSPSV